MGDGSRSHDLFRSFWSSEQELERKNVESLSSRLYRSLAKVAQLEQPLNESDFKRAMKKYGNDKKRLSTEFMTEPENYGPSLVLHSDEPPFDLYRLLKSGSTRFVYLSMAVIFILLSTLFGALSRWEECHDDDFSLIPQGFLLISGSRSFGATTKESCVWIETFATLIGTYYALPCFGAIVLIRFLAPSHKSLRISQRMLLTKRGGQPVLMLRLMNSNGGVYTGLECHLWIVVRKSDAETGEKFGEYYKAPLNCPEILDTCQNVTHKVEPDSYLIKNGVIFFDENNVPRFDRSKIIRIRIIAGSDTSWGADRVVSVKSWFDMDTHLVDAREDGALPTWQSAMIHFPGEFVKADGKVTNTLDLGMLSAFDYRETPTMHKQKEEAAEQGAEQKEKQALLKSRV